MALIFLIVLSFQLTGHAGTIAFIVVTPPLRRASIRHRRHTHQATQSTVQHAGVPPILQQLECGDSIVGFRTTENGVHNVTVERIAVAPPIFVLRNFVTHDECDAIQSTVTTMEPAQTASGLQEENTRKRSFVAWLGNDKAEGLVGRLADAVRRMMLIPTPSLGVEDMQVLRYDAGGEYVLHHDGHDRILTILYYLRGEGETFFPLAQTGDKAGDTFRPQARQEALDRAKGLKPGVEGVLVSTYSSTRTSSCAPITRGDAVAFYNYLKDGKLDWTAIHAGLPARNEKFVANHFFRDVVLARDEQ